MAANFLHGVETIELNSGPRSVSVVKSAVIALTGIAPMGPKNTPIVVNSDRDAAQFGEQLPGFSIPQSLDAIFKQGAGTVIVVNVFDAATHTQQVTAEAKTITDGKIKLGGAPIGAVTILTSTDEPATITANVDYRLDAYGNFTVINPTLTNGTVFKFTYKKLNPAAVLASHIIGEKNSTTGALSGLKCLDLSFNLFGFKPKIIIAPTFSTANEIAVALIAVADKFKGIAYIDAPVGTTVSGAIAGRGPSGTINFNTSSERAMLLYPHLKKYDVATNTTVLFPYSAFKAGVRAAVDNTDGFWFSDSNREIKGVLGSEVDLSAAVNDASTDTNLLNEKGITTVFNSYGSGLRVWGNRSASYPTNTLPTNFEAVRRATDVVDESIELACLQLIAYPIDSAWVDSVRETVNSFIRVLIGRGALIDGTCLFREEDNPTTELAAGHVTFYLDIMPPTPGERITFNRLVNIEYLRSLTQQ